MWENDILTFFTAPASSALSSTPWSAVTLSLTACATAMLSLLLLSVLQLVGDCSGSVDSESELDELEDDE